MAGRFDGLEAVAAMVLGISEMAGGMCSADPPNTRFDTSGFDGPESWRTRQD